MLSVGKLSGPASADGLCAPGELGSAQSLPLSRSKGLTPETRHLLHALHTDREAYKATQSLP